MSLFARTALGLDLTDGTLKAVLMARRGRRVELLRCWRVPWSDQPDLEAGQRMALRTFLRSARPGALPRVVVSAPDRGHLGSTYTVPVVEAERVAELVRYEVLHTLRVPADDLLLAHHLRKGVVESQVHAIALERGRVTELVRTLQELAVPFDELQPPGWALASFIEHEQPLGRDRIALGVGELTTTLLLMREDGLWSRHVPFGLSHARDPGELARRLHAEVAAAIAWFLPRDREFHPVDLVLTEEGALSGAITSALKRVFELPVTRFSELRRIASTSRRAHGQVAPAQALCMARAYGLALAGLGLARVHGALPVAEDPRRALGRRLPLAAASLLVSALGLAGMSEWTVARAARLEGSLPTSLAAEVLSGAARARELESERARLDGRLTRLSELAERRGATFTLRRALAAVSEVAATRGDRPLHLTACWLTTADAGRQGLLELTLEADPSFDEGLPDELVAAFSRSDLVARVRETTPAGPVSPLTQWRVEVDLP